MFKRAFWDSRVRDVGKKFYHTAMMPRDKSSYRLYDQFMINASWRLEREFTTGNRGGRQGLYARDWDGKF